MSDDLRVQPGTLLAAWPDLRDPNFMHSVVVICQHSPEGAYGLVTNRKSGHEVQELFPDHPILGSLDFPVHLGGPVDHTTLQFLHRIPDDVPGGVSLDGRLWLGGELDHLARYLMDADPDQAERHVRLCLGYSGWGAGQLESELTSGSWIPAAPSFEAVFGEPGEPTWRSVVRSIGDEGADLENLPPDISWN
jgi:putative transcriptional regulator